MFIWMLEFASHCVYIEVCICEIWVSYSYG